MRTRNLQRTERFGSKIGVMARESTSHPKSVIFFSFISLTLLSSTGDVEASDREASRSSPTAVCIVECGVFAVR